MISKVTDHILSLTVLLLVPLICCCWCCRFAVAGAAILVLLLLSLLPPSLLPSPFQCCCWWCPCRWAIGAVVYYYVTPHSSRTLLCHTTLFKNITKCINNERLPKHQNTHFFLINDNPFAILHNVTNDSYE